MLPPGNIHASRTSGHARRLCSGTAQPETLSSGCSLLLTAASRLVAGYEQAAWGVPGGGGTCVPGVRCMHACISRQTEANNTWKGHTCLNRSRSSALSMEGSLAPISSTLYLSRMPCCKQRQYTWPAQRRWWFRQARDTCRGRSHLLQLQQRTSDSALARLSAVWPPMVGRMASGRSCRSCRAQVSWCTPLIVPLQQGRHGGNKKKRLNGHLPCPGSAQPAQVSWAQCRSGLLCRGLS